MDTLDRIEELKKLLAATRNLLEAFEDDLLPACLRIDLHRAFGGEAHLAPDFAALGYQILSIRKDLALELLELERQRDDPDLGWAIHRRIA